MLNIKIEESMSLDELLNYYCVDFVENCGGDLEQIETLEQVMQDAVKEFIKDQFLK